MGPLSEPSAGFEQPNSHDHGHQICSNHRVLGKIVIVLLSTCDMHIWMYAHHVKQSMDQPSKAANPARGQLNRESEYFLHDVLVCA